MLAVASVSLERDPMSFPTLPLNNISAPAWKQEGVLEPQLSCEEGLPESLVFPGEGRSAFHSGRKHLPSTHWHSLGTGPRLPEYWN